SPSSGRSWPAKRRSRVVLPTPFGPTRPTRSPANSSKPISANNGPSSKPRARREQLNNSMVNSGIGLCLQETFDEARVRGESQGTLEERPGFILSVIKPQFVAVEEG